MRLCGAAPAPGPSTHRHCDAYRVDFFAVGFPNGFRTTAHELADLAKEPSFQKTLHPNLDPHGRIYSQGSPGTAVGSSKSHPRLAAPGASLSVRCRCGAAEAGRMPVPSSAGRGGKAREWWLGDEAAVSAAGTSPAWCWSCCSREAGQRARWLASMARQTGYASCCVLSGCVSCPACCATVAAL